MSDLCHNCGDCHLGALPRPCNQEMVHCRICNNWGHKWTFCPRGVRNIDAKYEYWMMCHNCDSWHLPTPCDKPMHQCTQCGLFGHLSTFCPMQPAGRYLWDEGQPGNKRKRVLDPNVGGPASELATNINQVHPDLFRSIQHNGAAMAMGIIGAGSDMTNYVHRAINHVAMKAAGLPLTSQAAATARVPVMQPVRDVNTLVQRPMLINNSAANTIPHYSPTADDTRYDNPYARKDSVHADHMSSMMTPVPSSAVKPMTALMLPRGDVYQAMHQSFARGELARAADSVAAGQNAPLLHVGNQDHGAQCEIDRGDTTQDRGSALVHAPQALGDTSVYRNSAAQDEGTARIIKQDEESASGTPAAPRPAGTSRAPPKPRCAACKKRHAKCTHEVETGAQASGKVVAGADNKVNEEKSEPKSLIDSGDAKPATGIDTGNQEQDAQQGGSQPTQTAQLEDSLQRVLPQGDITPATGGAYGQFQIQMQTPTTQTTVHGARDQHPVYHAKAGNTMMGSEHFGGNVRLTDAATQRADMSMAETLSTKNYRKPHMIALQNQTPQRSNAAAYGQDDVTMDGQQDECSTDEERDEALLDAIARDAGPALSEKKTAGKRGGARKRKN